MRLLLSIAIAVLPFMTFGQIPFSLSDEAFISKSSLRNQLVSWWRLEEFVGTQYDSIGTNHLTRSGGARWNTGVIGLGGDYTRSLLQYLSVTNTSLQAGGSNITIAAWVKLRSKPGGASQGIAGQYSTVGNQRGYVLLYSQTADRFQLVVSSAGTSGTTVSANTLGSPSLNTWYFVCGWTDGVNANISVNNGTADSTAFSGAVFDSSAAFQIGALNDGTSTLDGYVDEVAMWRRDVTASERGRIYNSGLGVTPQSFRSVLVTNPYFTFARNGADTFIYSSSRLPDQRNAFYAQGRYWLFFAALPSKNLYFTSSADGVTWLTITLLTTIPVADAQWSIKYDGTTGKLHFAKNTQTGAIFHDGLQYRRGTPNSDGTITWDAALQTAIATGNFVGDFSLEVATDGTSWVGYGDATLGNANVIKNSATDGTWSTAAGFPVTLTATADGRFAQLAALQGGGMFASVYKWNADVVANGYASSDGSATFATETGITDNAVEGTSGSAAQVARIGTASSGGVVHLAYQSSAQTIYHKTRSTGGVWSSETQLASGVYVEASPSIAFNGSTYLVAWGDIALGQIRYAYNDGAWSAVKTFYATPLEASYEHVMIPHTLNGTMLSATWLDPLYSLNWKVIDYTQ